MDTYRIVKAKNRLKNVKKKFLLISESSTSACEIWPWWFESPISFMINAPPLE